MLDNLVEKIVTSLKENNATDIVVTNRTNGYSIDVEDPSKFIRLELYDEKKVIITVFLNGYENSSFTYFVDIQNDPTNNYPYHKALYTIHSNIAPFENVSTILRTTYTFSDNEVDDMKGMMDEIETAVYHARDIEQCGLVKKIIKDSSNKESNKDTNVEEKPKETENESKYYDINTARETIIKAKDFLESKMVGQDEYIKHVCYILMQILTGKDVATSFFIGKSGSGKTYAWELLCKHDESPVKDILGYELIDASMVTAEAYRGCNLSQVLVDIKDEQKKKDFFVLVIDEFDKVLVHREHTEYELNLQRNYLQILAHGKVELNKEFTTGNSKQTVDFSDIPIVLLGAFQNYDFQIKMPKKRTIGFLETDECDESEEKNNQSIGEEILKMGAMPELVGRISDFHLLNVLDEDVLRNKLKQDIKDTVEKIKNDYNVTLEINSDIANVINIEESFGARSIKTCLNKIFDASIMYDISVEGKDLIITLDEDNNIVHREKQVGKSK